MKLIIAGISLIILGYLWMVLNASMGYTNAWWWFRWSDFKLILGLFHLAGAIIIALGLRQRRKLRASAQKSRP